MSKTDKLIARTKRAQMRMLRGQLAMQVREYNDAQRSFARKVRQSHLTKQARAARSLLHELGFMAEHGHGSGSHCACSRRSVQARSRDKIAATRMPHHRERDSDGRP